MLASSGDLPVMADAVGEEYRPIGNLFAAPFF